MRHEYFYEHVHEYAHNDVDEHAQNFDVDKHSEDQPHIDVHGQDNDRHHAIDVHFHHAQNDDVNEHPEDVDFHIHGQADLHQHNVCFVWFGRESTRLFQNVEDEHEHSQDLDFNIHEYFHSEDLDVDEYAEDLNVDLHSADFDLDEHDAQDHADDDADHNAHNGDNHAADHLRAARLHGRPTDSFDHDLLVQHHLDDHFTIVWNPSGDVNFDTPAEKLKGIAAVLSGSTGSVPRKQQLYAAPLTGWGANVGYFIGCVNTVYGTNYT
ncbi:hypothetical protein M3Y99_00728200 [Aphelenchoides fujianensis]|nr:hypothetical protein M3Y99_00728200 [Aphelenchoides fujianensis]